MKTFFTLFLLLCTIFIAQAQIPNNGFEDWSTFGNGMTVNGWWCSNDSINPANAYFPVTRSTDHYPSSIGSYSARLECNAALHAWEAFGLAYPGGYREQEPPSFPVTGHPISLCGYYKYLPQNGDVMNIRWILYRNGGVVAAGELKSGLTVSVWTAFSIPLLDNSYVSADSARITLSPFDWNGTLHGNSVLYVDNLSFDNLLSSSSELSVDPIGKSFYPNPATDIITLDVTAKGNSAIAVNMYDALGTLVRTANLTQNQQQIDISDLHTGIYLIEIKYKESVRKQKLIIER